MAFLAVVMGEKEKGEKIQTFSRRSKAFGRSEFVEPRVKVHPLDEGHVYIPKRRDFIEDQKEEISGNQGFQAREASYSFYYTSRGRVLVILVYFYLKGAYLNSFGLKGLFGNDLRGCLALFPAFVGCFMAQLGTVLGPFSWLFYGWFVGYFMAQLGIDFRTKKEGNWTTILHGNCSCI